ncbi:MAG: hypothetical protein ABSG43_10195 [Solirubrobacteraceae bacterium]
MWWVLGCAYRARARVLPLLAPHQIRQAGRGKALLVYGGLAALWLEQPIVFDDHRLQQKVTA